VGAGLTTNPSTWSTRICEGLSPIDEYPSPRLRTPVYTTRIREDGALDRYYLPGQEGL